MTPERDDVEMGLVSERQRADAIVCMLKSPALLKAFALSTLTAPPIGLAYLAGSLKSAGIAYQIVDAVGENLDQILPLDYCDGYSIGLSMDEIVARIDPCSDIVALSCMFSDRKSTRLNSSH